MYVTHMGHAKVPHGCYVDLIIYSVVTVEEVWKPSPHFSTHQIFYLQQCYHKCHAFASS